MLRLADSYGRVATDLRVSLTDRCNLRCTYCMPEQGLEWLPKDTVLTDDEVVALITIAVERLGVTEVRFTGGEPLLRSGLERIVAATAALGVQTALTTNGIGLAERASALVTAGLERVNVSLDTLSEDRFKQIARRGRLGDVLAGLSAAAEAGLRPVRVNAVLLRGVNDDEAPALLEFCLANGYELRFIEQMPLDPMHSWDRASFVTADEILASLADRWSFEPINEGRGGQPAETWLVDGGPERVGIIASMTRPFCAACNRTRLTADGQIRNCLFALTETDLRGALRRGADEDEVALLWQTAMAGKAAGHGVDDDSFQQPDRPMSAIGG
ncbi:MAG TPA: GTP 3',8-cyclase MoaA [Mycobacteriales bacterium]|jgi:cyclic pyranopterin phosphate synthase|nr:GTP 3',8-cyclase MoaA [Mycobacteriales bacterium]